MTAGLLDFDALVASIVASTCDQARDATRTGLTASQMIDSPYMVLDRRRELFKACGGAAKFWIAFAAWLLNEGWIDPMFPSRNLALRSAVLDAFGEDAGSKWMTWEEHAPACQSLLAVLDGFAPRLPVAARERGMLMQKVANRAAGDRERAAKAGKSNAKIPLEARAGLLHEVDLLRNQYDSTSKRKHTLAHARKIVVGRMDQPEYNYREKHGAYGEDDGGETSPKINETDLENWHRARHKKGQ